MRAVHRLLLVVLALLIGVAAVGQPFFSDENAALRNVFTFASERSLVPGHFQYGPLYSYLAAPFVAVALWVQSIAAEEPVVARAFVAWFADPESVAWALRIPAGLATLGLAGVLLRRAGRTACPSLGAAAVIALVTWPHWLSYSALGVPDTLVALLVVLGLAVWEQRGRGHAVPAGGCLGLAFAAKASALTVGLAWLAAPFLTTDRTRVQQLGLLGQLSIGFVAGTLLGAPSALLAFDEHLDALLYESSHVGSAGHLGDWGPDGAWLLLRLLPLGVPLLVALLLLVRHTRPDVREVARSPWLWGVVGAVVVLFGVEKKSVQYLFPLLSIAVFGLLRPRDGEATTRGHLPALAIGAVALLIGGVAVGESVLLDGRHRAGIALREHVRPGELVWSAPEYGPRLVDAETTPWNARPHVSEEARSTLERAWDAALRVRLESTPLPVDATLWIETDRWSDRFLQSTPPGDHPLSAEIGEQRAFYEELRSGRRADVELVGSYGGAGLLGFGNEVRIWRVR